MEGEATHVGEYWLTVDDHDPVIELWKSEPVLSCGEWEGDIFERFYYDCGEWLRPLAVKGQPVRIRLEMTAWKVENCLTA